MDTLAVVLDAPEKLALRRLVLCPVTPDDVVVEVDWSGISSGTEKLLFTGRMPPFPGLGYPLVPGYESVGRIVDAGHNVQGRIGEQVFVPGANCYQDARGLFGGTARRVIVPSSRAIPIAESLGRNAILLALAATAMHAIHGGKPADLIVGHGVLGRLLARLTIACGAPPPTVWEINPQRRGGGTAYSVVTPDDDNRRDYRSIYDVSGAPDLLDTLVGRMGKGGEIVLAGFYEQPLSFSYAPAFTREARIRIAAEWQPADLDATLSLISANALRLDGLISHTRSATDAAHAYPAAFSDPECLKMVLDWRDCA